MNILANLGGLFGGEGLVIFLVMLLLFGAKKLPELARGLGSAIREFSKAKDEIEHEITRPPVTPTPQIETARDTQPHGQTASASTPHSYHEEEQGVASPAAAATGTPAPATAGTTTHHPV